MKKIFTLLAVLMISLTAMAQDGELSLDAMLVDKDDENFNVEMQFGKEEEEPFEPVSMAGTLSSFSRTDDGDVSDQKPSVLTITDS